MAGPRTLTHDPLDAQALAGLATAVQLGAGFDVVYGSSTVHLDGAPARAVVTALQAVVSGVPNGLLVALPEELTTGQAADVLGVTRPTVVAMVNRGELTARFVGTHRRVPTAAVLALRDGSAMDRRSALDELTEASGDAGLYD